MSKAAVSVFAFGCYIFLTAITLVAAPSLFLRMLRLEPNGETWLRVFGMVLLVLALYYIQAARQEVTEFFRWTTWGRPVFLAGIIVLVTLRLVPAIVIVFGVVDLVGAVWTAAALRSQRVVAL